MNGLMLLFWRKIQVPMMSHTRKCISVALGVLFLSSVFISCSETSSARQPVAGNADPENKIDPTPKKAVIDSATYYSLVKHLSNGDSTGKWPVKDSLPAAGAILPFNRIIAYYGNLYSKNMGILGELPKDSMFKKLKQEVDKWQQADTTIKVIPALHYIAVTA